MKLEIYAVHDAAVGAFNRPLFFRSRGEAIRSFADAVGVPENGFVKAPQDYTFYHIGDFDDLTAKISPLELPFRVCGALDFMPPKDDDRKLS